jgi:prepilin-type N-terminal cleavage/methylation domain-containing protein
VRRSVRRARDSGRSSAGFTLIELLAVIAMFALIAAMVVPNLNLGGIRKVRSEASDLATAVEMARERAIITGRVHAVVVDVESGAHWIEWAAPLDPAAAPAAPGPDGERKLDLVPPPLEAGEELVPLTGEFGKPHVVESPVVILGVEMDGGLAESGQVVLRIDGDGATDPAVILFGDEDGENVVRVEVEPLADAVAVVNAQ